MNLLLFEPGEIDAAGRVRLEGPRAEHAARILRARAPGPAGLRAGIVDGPIGRATLERVEGTVLHLAWHAPDDARPPPAPRVDLLLALPRPKVLGRLLSACACVGVGRVMLSNAAKVERCYFDTHLLDPKHVRARLLDGLAQARDTRLPRVSVHRSFRKLVEDELPSLVQGAIRLVADVGVEYAAPPLRAACAGAGPDDRVLVAIGPEGGWVDFERGLLTANGFRPVSLGPRVLRSDIACVVALGLVHDALGARWASPPPAQSSRAAAP